MTKQTGTVDVSSFTTDAKFRTWGLACSTALQACGLVKTSDTGQINWASVTKPVATNTQAGYEIYRFDDSLQATKPVFIRIGFGSGGVASGNSPTTWLTVGTGSDGAGTITGPQLGALQGFNSSVTISNPGMPYYFTHTSNGYCYMNFGIVLAVASPQNNAGHWIVARTVNKTTGVATGDGICLLRMSYDGSYASVEYGIDFNTTAAFSTARAVQTSLFNPSYSVATGSSVPMGKTYVFLSNLYAISGALSYYSVDLSQFTTFAASPFGTNHTYMAMGNILTGFGAGGSNHGAVIWED